MKKLYKYLEKYSQPTRLDKEPHGTLWGHLTEEGEPILYIQVSDDKEVPIWIPYGKFLTVAFKHVFGDHLFMERCLRLYRDGYEYPASIINKILENR